MSDSRNYHLIYSDKEDYSGGYVEVHIAHNSHEALRNIETAIILAKLGYQIRLLAIDTAFRTPDAYLIKEQIYIEFKHNQTPTTGAINNEIRDAQKIKELWLIWKEELIRLKRKEIFDGTISRKIQ